jgi:chromosomal replication initiator protein
MNQILDTAAAVFEIPRAALTGRSRTRDVAWARQAVAWALRRKYPLLSLQEIGRLLGGRDHTTIMWALKAAEQRAASDPDYALRMTALLGK